MWSIFLFCAVVGGSVMVLQVVLQLIGIGAHEFDLPTDMPDDLPTDLGDGLGDGLFDGHSDVLGHGSTTMFGILSFRTIVAAVAFFGLVGVTALLGGAPEPVALILALGGGFGAMYGVYWLMRTLRRMGSDGTVRLQTAVGKVATVYIPIPPKNAGTGKIQVRLNNAIVELTAVNTAEEKLATGTKVEVTGMIDNNVAEIRPILEGHTKNGDLVDHADTAVS